MDTKNIHSGNNLKNFTQIPNEILDDTTLSLEEKGTLAIFFRNNSEWKVYVSELRTRSTNGRDATTSIIKKLSQKGYITLVVEKEQCRSVNGHYLNSEKYWALSDKHRQRMTGDWKPVNGERINEVSTLPIKEVNRELETSTALPVTGNQERKTSNPLPVTNNTKINNIKINNNKERIINKELPAAGPVDDLNMKPGQKILLKKEYESLYENDYLTPFEEFTKDMPIEAIEVYIKEEKELMALSLAAPEITQQKPDNEVSVQVQENPAEQTRTFSKYIFTKHQMPTLEEFNEWFRRNGIVGHPAIKDEFNWYIKKYPDNTIIHWGLKLESDFLTPSGKYDGLSKLQHIKNIIEAKNKPSLITEEDPYENSLEFENDPEGIKLAAAGLVYNYPGEEQEENTYSFTDEELGNY